MDGEKTVEVLPGQVSRADFSIWGTRTLSGRFYMTAREGESPALNHIVLQLELTPVYDPNRIVARGRAISDPETEKRYQEYQEYQEYLEELETGAPDVVTQLDEIPRSGGFRFEGLQPERYTLRVILDKQGRYFITREVDLTEGDVDLGVNPLTLDDFRPRRTW